MKMLHEYQGSPWYDKRKYSYVISALVGGEFSEEKMEYNKGL